MAGEKRFSRIPPESTGDRLTVTPVIEVAYQAANASFAQGDDLVGATSGFAGTVQFVREDTANVGILLVAPEDATREGPIEITDGEVLNKNGAGIALAVAANTFTLYTSNYSLVDRDNPLAGQKVDRQGSAYIRFTDGPAQLDAFGKLRVANPTILGEHTFSSGVSSDQLGWTSTTQGGGTVTHDANRVSALLTCGTGSGQSAQHSSDLYHHYFPGQSHYCLLTVTCGDTGKANLRRRWGYMDDDNGLYFEQDGTSLYVARRSKTSGSVVNTRVLQANWNIDTLDGSGDANNPSGINLDVTNIQLYFIEFAWLGAGIIRWGVVIGGERLIVHATNGSDGAPEPWSQTGSLPVRVEQENTGVAASTSELRLTCASVITEAQFDPARVGVLEWYTSAPGTPFLANTTVRVPMFSFRPKSNNHTVAVATSIAVSAIDSVTGVDDRVLVEAFSGVSTTGGTWANISSTSSFQVNETPSNISVTGAKKVGSWIVTGCEDFNHLHETYSYQTGGIRAYANGDPVEVGFVVTQIGAANNDADVHINMSWRELKN